MLERDATTGYPTLFGVIGEDELGRPLNATGRCPNKLGVPLNPAMLSINWLSDWAFDGCHGYGEDHENCTPAAARNFFRASLGRLG